MSSSSQSPTISDEHPPRTPGGPPACFCTLPTILSNKNFTLNLTQGVFIDRIYRINRTETWNFNAPILVSSVSLKSTAKCGILCPKTPLLTEKQLHAIHFFVATRNVCPLAIPESCAQNMGLRLLENHSFKIKMAADVWICESSKQAISWLQFFFPRVIWSRRKYLVT